MARFTFVCLAGKRLQIAPSPTAPGRLLIQILSADREVQASLTMEAEHGGALIAGVEASARAAVAAGRAQDELIGAGVGHE